MSKSSESVLIEPGQSAIIRGQHVVAASSPRHSCTNGEDMCLFHSSKIGCELFGTDDDRFVCAGRIFVTPERFLVLRLKGLT